MEQVNNEKCKKTTAKKEKQISRQMGNILKKMTKDSKKETIRNMSKK